MVERAGEFAAQLPDSAPSFAMTYLHFLDRGDWQRALTWLEKAHKSARPGSKLAHTITTTRAHFEAFYRRDSREAQRWFAQAPQRDDSADYWLSTATVRATQGNVAGASEAWDKAWEIARKLPATGVYDMDREQLRLVGVWLEELRTQPMTA
jgi:tetratricopeptide (TPR) repeat protein